MANMRTIIPDHLIKWDLSNNPLAPLTALQKEHLSSIEEEMSLLDPVHFSKPSDTSSTKQNNAQNEGSEQIASYQQLLRSYTGLEKRYVYSEDTKYLAYLQQLQSRHQEYEQLCGQVGQALQDFSTLLKQYSVVSGKTTSLYKASEQLLSDQEKLNTLIINISTYVKYFKEADLIIDKLNAPTISANNETFFNLLTKIDENISFVQSNPTLKESSTYLVKYKHCQSKAINLMEQYIFKVLDKATESILDPKETDKTADAAIALFYGRFQSMLPKIKPLIEQIESRSYKCQEYDTALTRCQQHYLNHRGMVLRSSVQKGLESIQDKYNGDHCGLVRHSCALLLHASIDEHRLFYQFFSKQSQNLDIFLESLCTSLYDTLRPFIIHIYHLETLAEICCILRVEMLDEHVHCNAKALQGFGNICLQLLHDVQERLVFRANLYLQSDVLGYQPSPGDLAYPQKLKMMQDIAQSIEEENRQMRMKKISLSSIDSLSSAGIEPVSRTHLAIDQSMQRSRNSNSPADLHGMWYPTVRRTLVCLSRLYRCVDRPVFQTLSQEAIMLCVQSIQNARVQIEVKSSLLDGLLFQIKHLLILREQIAPFQVDLTIKEYSLDFSKVKTAAFSLLEKRSRLFTLSNNALLEFLLESAPQMKEQLIDSRKHVDARLKSSCQDLIQHVTTLLTDPVIKLLEKESRKDPTNPETKNVLGTAQEVAAVVSDALRLIKFKLPNIQQSLQLYLANRETECILFRPIKNNIVAIFTQFSQLLSVHYTSEELLLIACPLPEQVSIMLSSTSLSSTSKPTENVEIESSVQQQKGSSDQPEKTVEETKNSET